MKEKKLLNQQKGQEIEGLKIKVSNSKSKSNSLVLDKSNSKESEEIKINIEEINGNILKNELNKEKKVDQIHLKTNEDNIEDENISSSK